MKRVSPTVALAALLALAPMASAHAQNSQSGGQTPTTREQQIEREMELLRKEAELLKSLREVEAERNRMRGGFVPQTGAAASPTPTPNPGSSVGSGGGTVAPDPVTGTGGATGGTGSATTPVAAATDTPATAIIPDQQEQVRGTPQPLPDEAREYLQAPDAKIVNPTDALALIKLAASPNTAISRFGTPDINDKDFHCIIHVLHWADDGKTVEKQNWYVYNNGLAKSIGDRNWSNKDFGVRDRLFGVRKVWMLYVHLNRRVDASYDVRYDFAITKKTPENLANLYRLFSLFVPGAQLASRDVRDVWGGGFIPIQYVPSDVTVSANYVAGGTVGKLDNPRKFDNEGLYWWDVSVGVPIRKISQLTFESTANTVTAKEVEKQNIFALLNLYPFKRDLKNEVFSWRPHFVGGVQIAKQPQNKILVGGGFGPYFANFYLGALFVKQEETQTLQEGDPATPAQVGADVRKRYKAQFAFGLNFPVRGIIEAFKKKDAENK